MTIYFGGTERTSSNNEGIFDMASIERTTYPRFPVERIFKEQELKQFYSLTPDELQYINKNIRGTEIRLGAQIEEEDIASLSPYITEHIKRFGDYTIDMRRDPAKILVASKSLDFVWW